ncbi:MAG: hypothetical protein K9N23_18590 [Akkermansiaceae bacterium]|nr:hypothetical protein [Akkermansiaceae bacterium]
MEWLAPIITPAAFGAMLGELLLGKRLGNQAMAWGAALALAPWLLDGVAGWFLPTASQLAFHATATHSLLLAGTAAAVLPRWLAPHWKRSKLARGRIAWFVGLAWGIGALSSCLTTPGAQLCWPIPAPRACANMLGHGDALPGLILAGFIPAIAILRTKKQQPKRRRRWGWAIGLGSGYLALVLAAKLLVGAAVTADLARRGIDHERCCVSPISWNPLLWRGLADGGDEVWLCHRSVWEWSSTPILWTVLPRNREAFARHAETREVRRIAASTDGWWICRPNKTGLWLADLRSGEQRVWGERKGMVDIRFMHSWTFEPASTGDPVEPIRLTDRQPGEQLKRLARRSFANHQTWDGLPRLAGVPGSLPEILRTRE